MPAQSEQDKTSAGLKKPTYGENEELAIVRAKEDLMKESFSSVDDLIPEKQKPTNFLKVFKPSKQNIKPSAKENLILRLM